MCSCVLMGSLSLPPGVRWVSGSHKGCCHISEAVTDQENCGHPRLGIIKGSIPKGVGLLRMESQGGEQATLLEERLIAALASGERQVSPG